MKQIKQTIIMLQDGCWITELFQGLFKEKEFTNTFIIMKNNYFTKK